MVKRKIEEEVGVNKKFKYDDNLSIREFIDCLKLVFSNELSEVSIGELSRLYGGVSFCLGNKMMKEDDIKNIILVNVKIDGQDLTLEKILDKAINIIIKNKAVTIFDIDESAEFLTKELVIKIINASKKENLNINNYDILDCSENVIKKYELIGSESKYTTEMLKCLVEIGYEINPDLPNKILDYGLDGVVFEKIRYIYSLNLKHTNLSEDNTKNLIKYIEEQIFQDQAQINSNYIKYRMYLKYMDNKCKSSLVKGLDQKIQSIERFKTINKTIETLDANQLIEQYEQDQNSFSGMPFASFLNLKTLSKKFFNDIEQVKLLNMLENDLFPYSDATFVCAAHYGYNDVVKFLLNNESININFQDSWGKTVLHYLAKKNSPDLLNEFILAGADFNIKDNKGKNILHILAKNNNIDLIKIIISKYNIDITTKDKKDKIFLSYLSADNKKAILFWAEENNNKELLKAIKPYKIKYANQYKLIHASANGYINIVNSLLSTNINLNIQDKNNMTPLYVAIAKNHKNVFIALITAGADFDFQDGNKGITPLHIAVVTNRKEMVTFLIEAGAELNIEDKNNMTPLHVAIAEGHKEIIIELIKAGAELNIEDKNNMTPLHYAIAKDYKDVVSALIKAGVELNIQDENNMTPLHYAIAEGHKEIIIELIKAGADFNVKDEKNMTPLHYAVAKDYKDVVSALIEAGAELNIKDKNNMTPLHVAIFKGHKDVAIALIAANDELNIQDKNNMTPLHYAISEGHKEIIIELIKAGADFNVKDSTGMTPLHYAVAKDYKDVVSALIKAGVELNIQDENNMTPLHYAIAEGHKEIIIELIKASAELNIKDKNNMTPLHVAIFKGHKDVAIALIAANDELNIQDENNMTPLHYAISEGHKEIIIELIKAGADFNVKDSTGMTPLHYAVAEGYKEIIIALMEAGADCNVKDNRGKKAIDYAQTDEVKSLLYPTKSFVQKLDEENKKINFYGK
jgi:ankyrin repeat protein